MKRRNFLPACLMSKEKKKNIGINTYTLHHMMNENPEKTLELIASAGYKWIEVAGKR